MKKVFMKMRFFAISKYGVTLAKADVFLPAFLQMLEMWSSKVSFLSNFRHNSFSVPLLFFLYPATLILSLSFVLTNKWHLSALVFKILVWNLSNKALDACSRDVTGSSSLPRYCHPRNWQYQCQLQQKNNLLKMH